MSAADFTTVGAIVSRITVRVAPGDVIEEAGLEIRTAIVALLSAYIAGDRVNVWLVASRMSAWFLVHWKVNGPVPSTLTLKLAEAPSAPLTLWGAVVTVGAIGVE